MGYFSDNVNRLLGKRERSRHRDIAGLAFTALMISGTSLALDLPFELGSFPSRYECNITPAGAGAVVAATLRDAGLNASPNSNVLPIMFVDVLAVGSDSDRCDAAVTAQVFDRDQGKSNFRAANGKVAQCTAVQKLSGPADQFKDAFPGLVAETVKLCLSKLDIKRDGASGTSGKPNKKGAAAQ